MAGGMQRATRRCMICSGAKRIATIRILSATKVVALGPPTVVQIGPDNRWVFTFAGYNRQDAPKMDNGTIFLACHRRSHLIDLDIDVLEDQSVKLVSDTELQKKWTIPKHGRNLEVDHCLQDL